VVQIAPWKMLDQTSGHSPATAGGDAIGHDCKKKLRLASLLLKDRKKN